MLTFDVDLSDANVGAAGGHLAVVCCLPTAYPKVALNVSAFWVVRSAADHKDIAVGKLQTKLR